MDRSKHVAIIFSMLLLVGLFLLANADIYGGFSHEFSNHSPNEVQLGLYENNPGAPSLSTALSYAILSAIAVNLAALSGLFLFSLSGVLEKHLSRIISFAIGTLLGAVFLHLMPHLLEFDGGFSINTALLILFGFISMFIVENLIGHTHSHPTDHLDPKHTSLPTHIKPSAFLISFGDGVHNLLDGLIIGSVYLVSIPSGIAITIATFLHEIPMELADYGILTNSGLDKKRALLINLITGMSAILGVLIAIYATSIVPGISKLLFALGIGNFIYIASAALLPDLIREENWADNILNLILIICGIATMLLLVLLN